MEEGLKHKSAANFRKALKLYESKMFPKALKTIDKVLAETPKHGESLALKALILSYLNKTDEAMTLAKEAIRCNMRSGMCWHTLGLLQKAVRNLEEALKCFMQASNFDSANHTILRDLSMLQVHLKDYEGYRRSRLKLLTDNPNLPTSWISLAVAEHLCNHREKAIDVLDSFWKSAAGKLKPFDKSEILLYKATIFIEQGRLPTALQFLEENKAEIVDKVSLNDLIADISLKLGNKDRAKECLHAILTDNVEDQNRFIQLEEAHGCENDENRLEFYEEMKKMYPSSRAVQRLPLNYAHGERFRTLANEYIKERVKRGIPSLANDIKALYKDAEKRSILSVLLEQHYSSLTASQRFSDEDLISPPNCLLWLLVLYSRHLYRIGDMPGAVRLADEAITHTPTIPDLYLIRAKLMKKQGLLEDAANTVNEGRLLDFHDRFLNNKAAKYYFRVNKVEMGQEVMGAFSRDGAEELNCHDNQSMWFELEVGEAFLRRNEFAKASEEFEWVQKGLEEIYEGQYDYHAYCMRKMTLRAYFRFLSFENGLFSAPAYSRAVCGMISCYRGDPASISLEKVLKNTKRALISHKDNPALNLLAFELYRDQGKFLLALRLLRKLSSLENYGTLKEQLVALVQSQPGSDVVKQSFAVALATLP